MWSNLDIIEYSHVGCGCFYLWMHLDIPIQFLVAHSNKMHKYLSTHHTRQTWLFTINLPSKLSIPGNVFIKHLKSNVYVTLNAIGSCQCNLCSHWLIQIFITKVSLWILAQGKYEQVNWPWCDLIWIQHQYLFLNVSSNIFMCNF